MKLKKGPTFSALGKKVFIERDKSNKLLKINQHNFENCRTIHDEIQVGYDTCDHSDDRILQQDMPPALQRVEGSSRMLEGNFNSLHQKL